METAAAEVSPSPSGRGLKGVLAKARRGGKDSSSVPSNNGTDNSSESHGIRSSLESIREKVRTSRESSIDDGTVVTSKSHSLSKLLPGRIKRRLKKLGATDREEESEERGEDGGQEEDGRGRSISDQAATSADPRRSTPTGSRSQSTLGGSSLMTYDETDTESPLGPPPPLVSHPSHAGYLTSTSPLIQTSTTIEPPVTLHLDDSAASASRAQKSTTFPVSSGNLPAGTNLVPRHATTLDPQKSESSLGVAEPGASKNSRGISPGTRIKGVFTSGSRKESPPRSPDSDSVKPLGSGNTLGVLFGTGEKRNSVNPRRGSRVSEAQTSVQATHVEANSPDSGSRERMSITTAPRTPSDAAIDAPLTTITPPTPTDLRQDSLRNQPPKTQPSLSTSTNPNIVTSPSGNMISHRRARSDSATHAPSKLSNAMSPPLTPTIEETRTPGSRTPLSQGSPGGAGGFFSSVFSMAQNATNSFITSNAQSKPKNATLLVEQDGGGELETSAIGNSNADEHPSMEKKQLAVDTLGTGDLSLSHLGIAGDSPSTNPSAETFPTVADGLSERAKGTASLRRDEAAARAEDVSAARAISAAYSDKSNDKGSTFVAQEISPGVPNKPTYDSSIAGDRTPPNGSVFEGEQNTRRSGSVRSRVGITRRHRNSSSATRNTVATLNGASQATLSSTLASGSTPKLTGFAVASKKRNRDFHQLFRSIPEDDYLIEDYSCALQREIILAGRIYVSEGHICFSSNILGWVTTVIISFDEIVSVEKESTAVVFPNAIAIQTLHARHTFRSLLSREATYELLIGIWKLSHPSLKSSLNGVRLDAGGTGDKTEKVDPGGSEDPSDISEEEEVYDEDEEEDEGLGSFTEAGNASDDGSEGNNELPRKVSALGVAIGTAAGGVPTAGEGKAGEKAATAAAASVDFPGPATHPPTECNDADTHYDKVVKDEVIPAPLGKVYSMVFGAASGGFMTRWFVDDQKFMDLHMDEDKRGLSEENRTRSYSYIKPLYAAIGPKQTKCITTENLDFIDLEKAVSVTVATQTPDVPSGNIFCTKTKYCLTWAPGNSTRLFVNCTIEWTGKSWLKGPIEKGANDGQTTYATDLVRALKAGVLSRSRSGTLNSKPRAKGKRKRTGVDSPKKPEVENLIQEGSRQQHNGASSLLEPLRGIFGPVVDIFSPLISANMVIGFLLLLLTFTWLRGSPTSSTAGLGFPGMSSPERIAAYEEIWRREESSLWDWLEERIGMESIAYPTSSKESDHEAVNRARKQREQSLKHRDMDAKIADESMNEREFAHAIKVTEERLEELKRAVQKKKRKKSTAAEV